MSFGKWPWLWATLSLIRWWLQLRPCCRCRPWMYWGRSRPRITEWVREEDPGDAKPEGEEGGGARRVVRQFLTITGGESFLLEGNSRDSSQNKREGGKWLLLQRLLQMWNISYISNILCPNLFFLSFHESNYICVKLLGIVPQVIKVLLIFFF